MKALMNPFLVQRVTLSRENINFAIWEGTELFNNSRRLKPQDTVDTKIRNCLFGAFGQQVMMNELGARRVTKKECPDFSYDVLVDHDEFAEWAGYHTPEVKTRDARVEIKDLGVERRTCISFYDDNIAHAKKSAALRKFDYMTCFSVGNCDFREYTADVCLIAVLPARTVANDRLWRDSKYQKDQKYLNTDEINAGEYGVVFL